MPSPLDSRWLLAVLLLAVTTAVFAGAYGAGFTYDDMTLIVNNPEVRSTEALGRLWWNWQARPVRLATFVLDFALFGDEPTGYHVHSVLWHAACVVLLFFSTRVLSRSDGVAFTAALLFAVHPIHVEAVTNVANRKEPLCLAFSLAGFLAWTRVVATDSWRRAGWIAAAGVAWILALFSKQVAAMLPLSLLVYELLYVSRERRVLLRIPWLTAAGVVAGGAALALYTAGRFERLAENPWLNGYAGELSTANVVLTSARAFWRSVELLVWPRGLCPDHLVELSRSLLEPATAAAWVGFAGLWVLALAAARRAPLAAFGLLWLLVHFLPVSNLIPTAFIQADRYLYVPSVGFCLLVAALGARAFEAVSPWTGATTRGLATVAVAFVVASHAWITAAYNTHWQSRASIWSYTLACNPSSFRAYNGLGLLALESGRFEDAVALYSNAIVLQPGFAQAYNNRATAYGSLGDLDRAQADFERAIALDPEKGSPYFNLAYLFELRGDTDRAARSYRRAAELGSDPAREALRRIATPAGS